MRGRNLGLLMLSGMMAILLQSELRAQPRPDLDEVEPFVQTRTPVAELLARMDSDEPLDRAGAVLELSAQGGPLDPVVAAEVAKLVDDQDPRVRQAAVVAMQRLSMKSDFAVGVYSKLLNDADPNVASEAVHALANLGPAVVPAMITQLENPARQYGAALVLAGIGPPARGAVEALIPLIKSEQPEVRREALMALGAIGPDAKAALPAALEALKSADQGTVLAAIYAIGKLGEAGKLATPVLNEGLQDQDQIERIASAWALASINPNDASVQGRMVPFLVESLAHPKDEKIRQAAAQALVDLKPSHEIVLPELTRVIQNSSPEVVRDAMRAIAAVGGPAVPGLVRMLEYPEIRPAVASSLAQFGPQAAPAVPALTGVLAESDPTAQREILFALAAIGPQSAPAIPTILPLINSDTPRVSYSALYALGSIGPAAAEVSPTLVEKLKSEDQFVRLTSAWALARINPQDAQVAQLTVPLLTSGLKSDRPFVRVEAADALGRMGAGAAAAAPALREALDGEQDEFVRQALQTALTKVSS